MVFSDSFLGKEGLGRGRPTKQFQKSNSTVLQFYSSLQFYMSRLDAVSLTLSRRCEDPFLPFLPVILPGRQAMINRFDEVDRIEM